MTIYINGKPTEFETVREAKAHLAEEKAKAEAKARARKAAAAKKPPAKKDD